MPDAHDAQGTQSASVTHAADSARPPGAETGAEAGALDETPARTVACRLDSIVRDSGEALSKLQALARTMHDVSRDANELITHHVHRVLEDGEAAPTASGASTATTTRPTTSACSSSGWFSVSGPPRSSTRTRSCCTRPTSHSNATFKRTS